MDTFSFSFSTKSTFMHESCLAEKPFWNILQLELLTHYSYCTLEPTSTEQRKTITHLLHFNCHLHFTCIRNRQKHHYPQARTLPSETERNVQPEKERDSNGNIHINIYEELCWTLSKLVSNWKVSYHIISQGSVRYLTYFFFGNEKYNVIFTDLNQSP